MWTEPSAPRRWLRNPEQCPVQILYPNILQLLLTHEHLNKNKFDFVAAQESWSPYIQIIECEINLQSPSFLCYLSLHQNLALQRPFSVEILLWSKQIERNDIEKAWPTSNPRSSDVKCYKVMEPEEDFCSSVYIIFCREPLLFAVFHNKRSNLKLWLSVGKC